MNILDRVHSIFDCHAAGDWDGALANLSPDVEFHEGGRNERTNVYRGREGVRELWSKIGGGWTAEVHGELVHLVGGDTRAISLNRFRARRAGATHRTIDTNVITIYESDEATGLIKTLRDLPFDWVAWEAFWQAVPELCE